MIARAWPTLRPDHDDAVYHRERSAPKHREPLAGRSNLRSPGRRPSPGCSGTLRRREAASGTGATGATGGSEIAPHMAATSFDNENRNDSNAGFRWSASERLSGWDGGPSSGRLSCCPSFGRVLRRYGRTSRKASTLPAAALGGSQERVFGRRRSDRRRRVRSTGCQGRQQQAGKRLPECGDTPDSLSASPG